MTSPHDQIVNGLFKLLVKHGQGDYIGESISQLDHSLQAADLATIANAADTTVAAALLHDCGQIIPPVVINRQLKIHPEKDSEDQNVEYMLLPSGQSVGRHGHDTIGAAYLSSPGFPLITCQLVHDHVIAKRYLTAVEKGYYDALSEASKASLKFQGGPFTPDEIISFEKDPLFSEKVAMRRFDDAAKMVGKKVPGLEAYRTVLIRVLSVDLEKEGGGDAEGGKQGEMH
ncbi:hypothetical protein D9758_011729 [Tetrapyrgos nigripes]|uniref:HD domain-containing protein n=1 Tax=Tetrapyrgos nigripes TaxID=182062 RepID=A0A8H5LMK9_9AGAR|nr:hypothetical protein D9758_011729 [Tetrapyrgos nigripes]